MEAATSETTERGAAERASSSLHRAEADQGVRHVSAAFVWGWARSWPGFDEDQLRN